MSLADQYLFRLSLCISVRLDELDGESKENIEY
jgi:hypothetical protein